MAPRNPTSSRRRERAVLPPPDPKLMQEARQLSSRYSVVITADAEGWLARCIEIPTAFCIAKSPEIAISEIREPIAIVLVTLLQLRRPLPSPLSESKRESQVNVKLTAEERLLVEGASKKQGFKGLSDFFRFAALQVARA